MNKQDLLLIDYLSEAPCKLKLLLSDESASIFNKPAFCLKPSKIVNLVSRLADEKLVSVSFNDQLVPLGLASSEIDEKSKDYILSLTKVGGGVWERAMQPDWSTYVGVSIQYDNRGNETATFEAANASTLQGVLRLLPEHVVKDVDIKKLKPWKPLYWKTLDVGHAITLTYAEGSVPDNLYCSIAQKWKKDWTEVDAYRANAVWGYKPGKA